VVLTVLAGCGSSGGSAKADPATVPTATTLPPGIPPPNPFGTGEQIGLGEWQLNVSPPVTVGTDLPVPVRLSNRRTRAVDLATEGLFTLQDGVTGAAQLEPVSIEGLPGSVAAGADVEGVVVFRPTAPLTTPTLFFHGNKIGGQPAYVQLVGSPSVAP
jgi:hypothetical protein